MKNNIIAIVASLLTIVSCEVSDNELKNSIRYRNGELSINIKSFREHHLTCQYFDNIFIDTLFNQALEINIEDVLNEKGIGSVFDEAYSLLTDGYIPIKITLDNKVDTMFVRQIELATDNNQYAKVVSGKICPIEPYPLSSKVQSKIKRFLALKEDKSITAMDIGRMCVRMNRSLYTAKISDNNIGVNIPVLKSFSGQEYRIESNLKADNYYLYAPVDLSDLNNFIQDMIDNDFPSSAKNLNSALSCFRKKGEGGRFVVYLIGINNNGSHSSIPVGLVAVDNIKPLVNESAIDLTFINFKYIHNCDLLFLDVPLTQPNVVECASISNGQFRGNAALFEVEFDSGIESISIKREIYHDYMKYSYRPEIKTIKLSDKESPYHFRYILDLFIGDNYIPITVTDKFGNSTNYTYKITMEEVKDDN